MGQAEDTTPTETGREPANGQDRYETGMRQVLTRFGQSGACGYSDRGYARLLKSRRKVASGRVLREQLLQPSCHVMQRVEALQRAPIGRGHTG